VLDFILQGMGRQAWSGRRLALEKLQNLLKTLRSALQPGVVKFILLDRGEFFRLKSGFPGKVAHFFATSQ
jgi:hypothetical protein